METSVTLIYQTLTMFLLAGIGFVLFKTEKISTEGSRAIGNILIYVVLPCVIINGFCIERTRERMIALGISAVASLTILMMSVLVAGTLFRNDPIAAFGAAFSNPGFFGVPLIVAMLSESAVFYIAAFIAFLNLFQWTYGVSVMTGKKGKIKIMYLFKAPFFLAIMIGMILFLGQIQLPGMLVKTISSITALNTPLAMFMVGVYLAQTDFAGMIRRTQNYAVCVVRLILIPLISVFVLKMIPYEYTELKYAVLIAASCPVGSNIAVYAQLHDKDYAYAVETVVVSTVFSIVTIPGILELSKVF